MSTLAACTIIAKNYLPYARVLAESFHAAVPDGRFFVLLVDRNDGYVDPAAEPFTLIEAEELDNVPALRSFLFKYTLLECNTAIKPYFLAWLFARFDLAKLVYFDPDILITRSLADLAALLDEHAVVLTPHLTEPIDDDAHPGELAILQSGAYNLGFIALRRGEVADRLLAWWSDRLYDQCLVRIERGLFVDQKWIDLAPGLFGDVFVLTHPGYNVAYWNLHGRRVTRRGDDFAVNGEPLVFFHFSGFEPESPEQVSKHQDRFTLADLGDAADLYRRYRGLVLAAGYHDCRAWPYAFGAFDNGVAIPEATRALYHELGPARQERFGDPFAAAGADSFFAWLNQPASGPARQAPYLSRLLARLHAGRADLRAVYPDPERADFPGFSAWLAGFGRYDLKLDPALLAALYRETPAALFTVEGVKRRVQHRLKRLYHSPLGLRTRQALKRRLGAERTGALRRRLKPARPPVTVESGPRLALPRAIERPGINLVGYLSAETGVGENARALARALALTGVPVSLHDLELNVVARREDDTFAGAKSDFPYDVNLFVVNADQTPALYEHLGPEVFAGRYNVGMWAWELETLPPALFPAFDVLHEVWTPSAFCADAVSAVAPVPVRRVPEPVEPAPDRLYGRDHFGLPEDAFVFFFMFNFLSYFERKNPLAVIRAFRAAFPAGGDPLLLLKTSQSDFAPAARRELEEAAAGAGVRWLDGYLQRDEILSLAARCDAYVSLHRSEGFGLTLAEAMYYGKPVIATAYSGNTDFCNLNNGFPVRYERRTLERDAGPYPAGSVWAEPSVEHAAELMRQVYEDRDEARRRGERAAADVRRDLSLAAVGRCLEARFAQILAQVRRAQPRRPVPT